MIGQTGFAAAAAAIANGKSVAEAMEIGRHVTATLGMSKRDDDSGVQGALEYLAEVLTVERKA